MLSNAQWETFACRIAEGSLVGDAYKAAGYKVEGNSAEASGCRLLKRPEVAARVAELKAQAAEQTGVTLERLIQMGVELFTAAKAAEDFTAASSTYERLAKIAGHWIDRSENKSTVTRLISDRPAQPDDEEAWLRQHAPNAPVARPSQPN